MKRGKLMKKIIIVMLSAILLTSCALQSVRITPLSEKDSIYDLDGEAAQWQGGEVEEEWHRLHSADYNEAAKDAGYFFGYVTSIEAEDDRLMVTVENYGDNIKSGAYRFPVYDSTPIFKYHMSRMRPSDLYVGLMVIIVYYDYSPSDAGKKVNDVAAYTVAILNNEEVSTLPKDMEFVMTGKDINAELPAQAFAGTDPISYRGGAKAIETSAKSKELSEKEIAKLNPAEFKAWYESKLAAFLEKNEYVRFYYGYVAYYEEYKGKTFIVVTNKDGTSINNSSFNVRIFDSTVIAKEGKVLKPSDLKVGQKVIIAYYIWDTTETSDNSQAVYHVEILDTKDTPDPLPDGVVDIHHGDGGCIPVAGEDI